MLTRQFPFRRFDRLAAESLTEKILIREAFHHVWTRSCGTADRGSVGRSRIRRWAFPRSKTRPSSAAPDKCLFYFSSAGLAEPVAGSTNHTEQLLANSEVQTFFNELARS